MRDERNSLGKNSEAQISADDLLARLKLSYDGAGETKKERPDSASKQYDKSLMIDDDVYREAEKRVHTSEAVTALDDSDLDIDELIEMYITKPKAESEARAAEESLPPVDENGDNIELTDLETEQTFDAVDETGEVYADEIVPLNVVELLDAADALESSIGEDEIQVAEEAGELVFEEQSEYAGVAPIEEAVLDEEWTDPDAIEELELVDGADAQTLEDIKYADEIFTESDADLNDAGDNVIDEALISDDDSDMKLAEPVIEEALADSDFEDAPVSDDIATAVFDISQIKHMADEVDEDFDRVIDEAFTQSATEVFTPVSEADVENLTEQHDDTCVYGQPDSEEIDQTDLHIMLAFGMDDQLKETVGEEKATEIEDDIIQKHEQTSQINVVKE